MKSSLNDGGTIEYRAILYQIYDYHKMDFSNESGYYEGIGIKILGIEVYNSQK